MAVRRDARGRFAGESAVSDDPVVPRAEEIAEPSNDFLAELQASWARYGAETIETVRRDRPQDYLRLMASSFAKRADVSGGAIEAMSDDEIADELRHILEQLAAAGAGPCS